MRIVSFSRRFVCKATTAAAAPLLGHPITGIASLMPPPQHQAVSESREYEVGEIAIRCQSRAG